MGVIHGGGSPFKSDHVRSLSGRPPRKNPIATTAAIPLEPLTIAPPMPEWLCNGHAVKEWNRLVPLLIANRLLSEPGISHLAALCCIFGEMAELWTTGRKPTPSMYAQYRAFSADFGLTPLARMRVLALAPKQTNEFAKHDR